MASQPRILFLDHVGALGGAELCLIDLARHTKDRAKVILMADGPLRGALQAVGAIVEVLPLPPQVSRIRRNSGLLGSLRTSPHVLRLAFKIAAHAREYDLIWATSQKAFVIGCCVAFLSRRPLVWHLHDILTAEHFSRSNRSIAVALANRFASRVVAVSRAGAQSFVDSKGKPRLVRVVYNGIDVATFGSVPGNKERSRLREEFNIGTAPLVGVFGRLTPWKGQHVLLRALPTLPGVHAVLVGDALFAEQDYAQSLKELAAELGVADRTHFAGFRADVAGAMAEVDIVAHTSTSPEPFGRVLVEAMLARRPLVAAAGGGAAEIVTHGCDGVLVPPGNPPLLAKAILELLENPSATVALVSEAYKTATTRFTLEAFLSGLDAVAAEVMQQSHPAAVPLGSALAP